MFSALARPFARSLGRRISAWYAAGFIMSFLLIGLFAAWIIEDSGLRADREEIRERFDREAARYRKLGPDAFLRGTGREPSDIEAVLVRLGDTQGRTLLLVPSSGEEASEVELVEARFQAIRTPGWQQIPGGEGKAFWQVYTEAMPDGCWLQAAMSDRRRDQTQARLRAVVLPVAGVVLLAALVGAAGLTRQALRPVRQLIDTTRQVVQRGDMTARVPAPTENGDELNELNGLFNQMLARNETLIRGMQEALDNVAHDLRTPLTRLRSSAEAALRTPAVGSDARGEALTDAIEESGHALAVLSVLMDISEAENGVMRLQLASLSLAELVRAATDLYEYVAEERQVRFRIDVPQPLIVWADRIRVQQAIANLLDNAVKYSASGGEVSIEAGWQDATHGEVWLRVRDQGSGIAAHDLPRIWDRLYRGDRSRSQRGSGLGLSLVKAIAQAHGGRVEVTSEPGVGSVFTMILPARDPGAGAG